MQQEFRLSYKLSQQPNGAYQSTCPIFESQHKLNKKKKDVNGLLNKCIYICFQLMRNTNYFNLILKNHN